MGDEQFYGFLQDYCQTQSHKLSNSADFFSVLSRHTDEDLTALLDEYFVGQEGHGE